MIATMEGLHPGNPDDQEFVGPDSIWKLDDGIWYEGRFYKR